MLHKDPKKGFRTVMNEGWHRYRQRARDNIDKWWESFNSNADQYTLSLVLLQCLLLALYLMVLSVLYLNQLGRGRFCLCFLASLFFINNDLLAPINLIIIKNIWNIWFYIGRSDLSLSLLGSFNGAVFLNSEVFQNPVLIFEVQFGGEKWAFWLNWALKLHDEERTWVYRLPVSISEMLNY